MSDLFRNIFVYIVNNMRYPTFVLEDSTTIHSKHEFPTFEGAPIKTKLWCTTI